MVFGQKLPMGTGWELVCFEEGKNTPPMQKALDAGPPPLIQTGRERRLQAKGMGRRVQDPRVLPDGAPTLPPTPGTALLAPGLQKPGPSRRHLSASFPPILGRRARGWTPRPADPAAPVLRLRPQQPQYLGPLPSPLQTLFPSTG